MQGVCLPKSQLKPSGQLRAAGLQPNRFHILNLDMCHICHICHAVGRKLCVVG